MCTKAGFTHNWLNSAFQSKKIVVAHYELIMHIYWAECALSFSVAPYLLGELLFLQTHGQHVGEGLAALLVEDVVHERRQLGQHLEAQRDAVHIVVRDWFLGQSGLAQVQDGGHDEHRFGHKGLKKETQCSSLRETIQYFGFILYTKFSHLMIIAGSYTLFVD